MALNEIGRRLLLGSRVLTWTGAFHAVLAVVALALMPFDERTILGVDPWLKPFKFMASLAIYEWTVALILAELGGRSKSERIIAWGASLMMIGETVCLWMQSARGTTSHFNASTEFDGTVFSLMGIFILINTLLGAWLLVLFFKRKTELPPAALWGIRLGLIVFLIGSFLGAPLLVNGGHSVGVADGGPGLPLVNWSSEGGDLRIAHALGLHGLQLFAFLGYALARAKRSASWLGVALLVYLGAITASLVQAWEGIPLVSSSGGESALSDV